MVTKAIRFQGVFSEEATERRSDFNIAEYFHCFISWSFPIETTQIGSYSSELLEQINILYTINQSNLM